MNGNGGLGWSPIEGQNYGETTSTSAQMPGGYNLPIWLHQTHIYYAGAWAWFNGVPFATNPGYHGLNWLAPYTIQIFDKACPE
jgi:hypothetical protein